MRLRPSIMMMAALLAAVATVDCWAQPPEGRGGRRGGFGGGRGIGRLALLRVEAVQKELDLVDTQVGDIEKLQTELRGQRGQRGQRGERGQRGQRGQREGTGDLSDDERQARIEQRRKQAQERANLEVQKLEDVLLPHQMKRLTEIYVQAAGISVLEDPQIAERLKIDDAQRKQLAAAQDEVMGELRGKMRELFESGDRDAAREKMTELRKEAEKKILAALSAEQRTELDKMKGDPFDVPADALRGGRQRGGRGGGDRPRRPQRPDGA